MASLLTRLANLFPGYRGTPTVPPPVDPALARLDIVKRVKADLENTPRRARPSSDEKLPTNYHGGIAGKVWFLPYQDSTTRDTPEVRAAMRLMRRDGYVKAAWEPQVLTVASEDWQVQPSEAGNPEAEKQADFCKFAIEDYLSGGIVSLVRAVCAPFGSDGFSLAEKVWQPATRGKLENKIVLAHLKARDVDSSTVRLQGDRFGNVTGVQSARQGDQTIYPISDFVFSRYMTVFDEPLGEAAFRPAYGPYWMRDTVRKLRAIHHEKKMAGMLVGTYAADDDKGPLETALRAAKSSTWMTIPEGTRVEAVALSTASEPDYKSFDESLRDEIVTAIAFATLQIIQGNVPDARGDSKTQKAMADLGPWLLMVLVSEAANKQIFPDLIDFNFPYAAGGAYPKLTFGAVSNSELMELLQLVQQAQQLGLKPSRKHYAKALSIQEADPNDPDDDLGSAPGMGGMPPGGDPFGGGGGGGGFPPDPMGGAPGGMQQFSEDTWYEFRDPVKWERQQNGSWKSSGGRVLSDAAYQRHVGRMKKRTQQSPAPSGPPVPPEARPGAAPRTRATVGVAPSVEEAGSVPPILTDVGLAVAAAAAVGRGVKGSAAAAGAKVKQAAREVGRRVADRAAKTEDFVNRVAAKVGLGGTLSVRALAKAGEYLGKKVQSVGWLEGATGLGEFLEKKSRRVRVRLDSVAEGFRHGAFSGKKELVREVSRVMGWHYKESARKYGRVLGFAVEAAMQGWTFGKMAVLGGVGVAAASALGSVAGGVGAAGAAIWAGNKVAKTVQKVFGIGLKPVIRNKVEYTARQISDRFRSDKTPLGPAQRNAAAPGRIAQALDWAEGLSKKKFDRAASGKGVALWYVKGDRRATGSGRGGKVSAQQAARWVQAKREVQAADAEGRKPDLPDGQEAAIRRAMQIQLDGTVRTAATSGGMVAGSGSGVTAARASAAREMGPGPLYTGGRSRSRRFAESPDEAELVADLRAGVDDVRQTLGLPPIEATDEELAGSLSLTLSLMDQTGREVESFSEADWEAFGWSAGRTRKNTLKAVGTGPDQGKTLYGAKAKNALATAGGARPGDQPRNVAYTATTPGGGKVKRRETGVSPERARAMAIAGKVATAERASGESPTQVRVTTPRKPRAPKELAELAPRVAAGDPVATQEVRESAAAAVESIAAEVAKSPPKPGEIRAAWGEATGRKGGRAELGPTWVGRTKERVGNLLSGMFGNPDAKGVMGGFGRLVNWLGKLGGRALKVAVRSLGKFAAFAATTGFKAGRGIARAVGRAAGSDTVRPFLHWAGGMAAAAAIVAAPALAVNYGLIHWAAGMAIAPLAVAGAVKVGRAAGRAASGAGLKNTGLIAPHSEFSEGDVALAGKDGARANLLLSHAQQDVARLFAEKCERATERLLASEQPMRAAVLFSDEELSEIASGLGRVIATADLLGRARIRRHAEFAERRATFAESPDDVFHDFAEPIPPLAPLKAIEFIRARVPTVDPGEDRYGSRLDRHATTLAIASDEVLLERIKEAIAAELEGGGDATPDIAAILERAGVGVTSPQYPEMIARTNAMLAYNQGAADELADPGMQEAFPAWEYLGVMDSRTGDDHRPHIGKYYPSTANFAEVRGPRIWNCRCSFAPVHRSQMNGVRVENFSESLGTVEPSDPGIGRFREMVCEAVRDAMGELKPPTVNVPAPVVNVPAPVVNITLPPRGTVVTRKTVERDADGNITGTTERETEEGG